MTPDVVYLFIPTVRNAERSFAMHTLRVRPGRAGIIRSNWPVLYALRSAVGVAERKTFAAPLRNRQRRAKD